MRTTPIRELLAAQPVLAGLTDDDIDLLAGCARNERLAAGALLAREGTAADSFWVVRTGRVAVELAGPAGPLVISTIGPGELVGWAWILPPYRWTADAEAVEPTSAVRIDGACLRGKCDDDPAFGYRVMGRFAELAAEQLEATQLRLLDLYGAGAGG